MKRLLKILFLLAVLYIAGISSVFASCSLVGTTTTTTCSNNSTHFCQNIQPGQPNYYSNNYYSLQYICTNTLTDSCNNNLRNITSGLCPVVIIACPTGKYAPLGSTSTDACVAVPNCNSTAPIDGKFFNINTAQCEISTNITICMPVSGLTTNNYYCPPINDCIAPTQVCSNNAADVTATQNARTAEIAAIKARADAKLASTNDAAAQAAAAAAAKQIQKDTQVAAAAAAKISSDTVVANPAATPSLVAAAAQAYSESIQASVQAAAKAANSVLAAATAHEAATAATGYDEQVSGQIPGNASALDGSIGVELGKALTALNDSISGLGSGTGTGQGASAGTCVATGTCTGALAKDTTLAGANDKLTEISGKLTKDTVAYTGMAGVRTISASTDMVSNKFRSKLPTVVFSNVEPTCPVFTKHIPFINVDLVIDQFCTMDAEIRPSLQLVSLFIYSLMAFLIILRA